MARWLARAVPGGAATPPAVQLSMHGRIRVGVWLPFTAEQDCDGRSFTWRARVGWGPLRPLTVVDAFARGHGSTRGTLAGGKDLFAAQGADATRSAAARAALESVAFAPAAVTPERGVDWHAEAEDHLVARFDLPPERPEVHLHLDGNGALRAVSALRWGGPAGDAGGYVPFGAHLSGERRFGGLVVPTGIAAGWWWDTPRWAPFFRATIDEISVSGYPPREERA